MANTPAIDKAVKKSVKGPDYIDDDEVMISPTRSAPCSAGRSCMSGWWISKDHHEGDNLFVHHVLCITASPVAPVL